MAFPAMNSTLMLTGASLSGAAVVVGATVVVVSGAAVVVGATVVVVSGAAVVVVPGAAVVVVPGAAVVVVPGAAVVVVPGVVVVVVPGVAVVVGAAVVVVVSGAAVVVVVVVGAPDISCRVVCPSVFPPETLRFRSRSSGLAAPIRNSRMASGLTPGFSVLMSATSPVTCGAAIEVPDMWPYVPPGSVERMSLPGAAMSTLVDP
jgi:hypothetical protein